VAVGLVTTPAAPAQAAGYDYFDAMTQVRPWAAEGCTVDNMVRGKPEVPVTANFNEGTLRGRFTRDAVAENEETVLRRVPVREGYQRYRPWSMTITETSSGPVGFGFDTIIIFPAQMAFGVKSCSRRRSPSVSTS
jgi:hypothetical protein